MKQMIQVVLPTNIAHIVSRKYTSLRRQMRRKTGRAYPIAQLYDNIRNALSINGCMIELYNIKVPTYNKWKNLGYKVISSNHWYYAIQFKRRGDGSIVACAVDALYEGDYHNDIMQTKPYECKEMFLSHIISESINNLIREVEEADRQRRIQRIVCETIERFISNLVA